MSIYDARQKVLEFERKWANTKLIIIIILSEKKKWEQNRLL